MITVLYLAAGIAMLFGGGDLLVRGASGIARLLKVSPLIIGLTVVAFGTSAPELVVNLIAVLHDSPGVAFGNVVGSNLANIGLILGLAAVLKPMEVDRIAIVREIPMMILVSAAAVIFGIDRALQGTADVFSRADGLVLLLLFGVFLYYNVFDAVRSMRSGCTPGRDGDGAEEPPRTMGLYAVMTVAGLALLVAGGKATVVGAVAAAQAMGVSEGLIGLTVVAVGTSLPELAASLIAAWRNEPELAVGNVVGSNIFNLAMVLGLACTISPVAVPEGGRFDLAAMLGISLVLLPIAMTSMRRITRTEGAFLLAVYCAYITLRSVTIG